MYISRNEPGLVSVCLWQLMNGHRLLWVVATFVLICITLHKLYTLRTVVMHNLHTCFYVRMS